MVGRLLQLTASLRVVPCHTRGADRIWGLRSLREGLAGTNGHPCCVLGSCLQGSGLWGALEGRCSSAAHRDVSGLRFGM